MFFSTEELESLMDSETAQVQYFEGRDDIKRLGPAIIYSLVRQFTLRHMLRHILRQHPIGIGRGIGMLTLLLFLLYIFYEPAHRGGVGWKISRILLT